MIDVVYLFHWRETWHILEQILSKVLLKNAVAEKHLDLPCSVCTCRRLPRKLQWLSHHRQARLWLASTTLHRCFTYLRLYSNSSGARSFSIEAFYGAKGMAHTPHRELGIATPDQILLPLRTMQRLFERYPSKWL